MIDTASLENLKSQLDTQGGFTYSANVPTLTTVTAVAIPYILHTPAQVTL